MWGPDGYPCSWTQQKPQSKRKKKKDPNDTNSATGGKSSCPLGGLTGEMTVKREQRNTTPTRERERNQKKREKEGGETEEMSRCARGAITERPTFNIGFNDG